MQKGNFISIFCFFKNKIYKFVLLIKILKNMELLNQLEEALERAKQEAGKFYENGNNSAGTRLRKEMQTIKTLAQSIRNNVTETKAEAKV